MTVQPNKFSGWRVLAALFVVGAIGPMSRYGLSSLFPAISNELGWSRSEIGLAQSISLWAYSLVVILTGWMIDRFGSRKTIFMGGLWCLVGWLLLSMVSTLWQLYIFYGVVMAVAMANTHLVPTQSTSRKWFIRKAGLASGIVGSAFAVGNAIFSPLITSMSGIFGWREVSFACAFLFSIPILLLAYLVIRDTPESVGQHPDGVDEPDGFRTEHVTTKQDWGVRDALKTHQLWVLFIVYGLSGIVLNALQAHLVIWAVDLGSSMSAAGLFITLINVPSVLARIFGGWLSDRYGKMRVLKIGTALGILVTLIGWQGIHNEAQFLVFVPILGFGTSMSNALFAPLIGDLFGRRKVGSLFAVLTLGWGLIGGFGPIIWGVIFDSTGSYQPALLVSAVCYTLALIALLLMRPTIRKNSTDN